MKRIALAATAAAVLSLSAGAPVGSAANSYNCGAEDPATGLKYCTWTVGNRTCSAFLDRNNNIVGEADCRRRTR